MNSIVDTKAEPFATATVSERRDLIRFIARRLRCRATAEDLVQEAYIRLLQVAQPLRSSRAFLFHTVTNLALNHSSDERRRADLRREVVAPQADRVDSTTPERSALAIEELRAISDVFGALPARTREVFILNRFDGLNQREIAERLGISLTVVEKHMSRAVLRLSAAMNSQ